MEALTFLLFILLIISRPINDFVKKENQYKESVSVFIRRDILFPVLRTFFIAGTFNHNLDFVHGNLGIKFPTP